MRDIVVAIIIFGSLPIIILRPYLGVLMWSWLAYMVPHKLTWGFAYDFPFAQIVAIATIAGWLLSKERKSLPIRPVTVLLIALLVWVSFTTVFAELPQLAYKKWDQVMKVLVTTLLSIILLTNRQRIEGLVWVIALSLGFYGAKGGIYFISGGQGLVFGPRGGLFGDNTSLALALVMVIPIMRYLWLNANRLWLRIGIGGVMALSLAAAVGSYSRGALVGGAAMLGALVLSSRRRAWLIAATVAGVIAMAPLVPQQWVDRMWTIRDYEQDSSAMGRIQAWTFAWRLALDRPITGGGFLVNESKPLFFKYVPDAYGARSPHSIYFEVLGEHGFIGLAIFIALLLAALTNVSSVIRATRKNEDLQWASDLVRMLRVSLVGYMVCGLFLNRAYFDLYYHIVALIFCTKLLVESSTVRASEPAQIDTSVTTTQAVAR